MHQREAFSDFFFKSKLLFFVVFFIVLVEPCYQSSLLQGRPGLHFDVAAQYL